MTTNHERPFEDLRTTLGEYGRVARHRWRVGFIGLAVVSSIAFWHSQYLPRRYTAGTLFERRDDVVLRNLVHANSPYSFRNLKSTLVMDMTGSRAMVEAAASVGLLPPNIVPSEGALSNKTLRALDGALGRYELSASVNMIQSSPGLDTIRLNCTANDPEIAQRFAVTLRDRYIAETRGRITDVLLSTKEFFESEVETFRREAAEVKRALREQFKDFPGVDPTDLASAGARLETLRQEETRLSESKAGIEAQVSAREEFLISTVTLAEDSEPAESAAQVPAVPPMLPESDEAFGKAIRDVERQIAEAMTMRRMTEEHPQIQALNRKREGLYAAREAIRAQRAALVPATEPAPERPRKKEAPRVRHSVERLRVELELDSLRRQYDIVAAAHGEAERRAAQFTELYGQLLERGQEFREIRDKLDQDATTIAMWRQHLGQLKRILSAESEQRGTQFALIEEPKDADRPVSPRIGSVMAVCAGAGLAVAALLVALTELLDRSFRSTGQITRVLGVPVLECVGTIPTPQVRRRRRLARMVWSPALGLLLGGLLMAGGLAYVSLEKPGLHQRAIAKIDSVLDRVGAPNTALLEPHGK